jgi:hypothetical protein
MAEFRKETQEQADKRRLAARDEAADMIVAGHSNADIRLRVSAIWSIYFGDVQINVIRQKIALHGRKNAFDEEEDK